MTAPEDTCTLDADCDAKAETTVIGWAGIAGWVFDACWPCAHRYCDPLAA